MTCWKTWIMRLLSIAVLASGLFLAGQVSHLPRHCEGGACNQKLLFRAKP